MYMPLTLFFIFFLELGPEFGSPPSFMRKKLLTVLNDYGKTSSFIDDISIVRRYTSEASHAFPVSSDVEALSKAKKEVDLTNWPYASPCLIFGVNDYMILHFFVIL